VPELMEELEDSIRLQFPETELAITYQTPQRHDWSLLELESDAMLQPALLNLVQNGIKSNAHTNARHLNIEVGVDDGKLTLAIRDFGRGITEHQESLGLKLVASENGLGMAMLLSNTTFERLGGALKLLNHPQQGAVAHVVLPVQSAADH